MSSIIILNEFGGSSAHEYMSIVALDKVTLTLMRCGIVTVTINRVRAVNTTNNICIWQKRTRYNSPLSCIYYRKVHHLIHV